MLLLRLLWLTVADLGIRDERAALNEFLKNN